MAVAKVVPRIGRPIKVPLEAATTNSIHRLSLPPYLMGVMMETMKSTGYNGKQRSVWIEEAIAGLIVHDSSLYESSTGDRVSNANGSAKYMVSKTVIRASLAAQVDILILETNTPPNASPINFSYIARCAIRHRLRHPELYPVTSAVRADDLISQALKMDLSGPF